MALIAPLCPFPLTLIDNTPPYINTHWYHPPSSLFLVFSSENSFQYSTWVVDWEDWLRIARLNLCGGKQAFGDWLLSSPCMRAPLSKNTDTISINNSSSLPYPPLHTSSSLRGSLYRLFGCCMRPQHSQDQEIIRAQDTNGSSSSNTNSLNLEFGSNVFTQLGPNDVSYKTRSEPKMVHQYILGGLLGEGTIFLPFPFFHVYFTTVII